MAPLYFRVWSSRGRWVPGQFASATEAAKAAARQAEHHKGADFLIVAALFNVCIPKPPPSPHRRAGGYARAASLTPERRQEIARDAANARWRPGEF